MGETLTPQQLRNNSYHLAIRSSLLAIQSTLLLQKTMLQSQHATFTDIKATIASQNSTLQNTTKALVELFSKISTFQPPPSSSKPPTLGSAAPLQPPPTLGSAAPLQSSPPSENSSTATSQQVYFDPPHFESANNRPVQLNQPKLHIEYSNLNNEKSRLPDDSETISQTSNPDSMEMLDVKASTTIVDSESTRVNAGVIARLQPQFNPKLWSSHVETLDKSWEKERKSALGDARNLFDKIIRKTELLLQLNKYEISSSTVSMFYLNDPLDCTLIVGENNVFIFDPGGHNPGVNHERKASVGDDIVIVAAYRTAICKAKCRAFKDSHPEDLLAPVLKALLDKTNLNPSEVDDIIVGIVLAPGSQRAIECRRAAFYAGFPENVPLRSVYRQCSFGLQAIAAIKVGFYDIGIAAGLESMTVNSTALQGPSNPRAQLYQQARDCFLPMGITSEDIANKYGVTRQEQDMAAVGSHKRAAAASASGKFKEEIVSVYIKILKITVNVDEGIQPDTSMEGLARLKPAFAKDGSTTAGNASQVSDGAGAVLLMKRSVAMHKGLLIIGVFRSFAAVVGTAAFVRAFDLVFWHSQTGHSFMEDRFNEDLRLYNLFKMELSAHSFESTFGLSRSVIYVKKNASRPNCLNVLGIQIVVLAPCKQEEENVFVFDPIKLNEWNGTVRLEKNTILSSANSVIFSFFLLFIFFISNLP